LIAAVTIISLAVPMAAPAFALELDEVEEAYLKIVRKVRPTVVHISFSKTFGRTTVTYLNSTGVILDNDGTIVTISKAVLKDSDVTVEIQGHEPQKGKLLGVDKLTGIAVVKIDCEGLKVTDIGNSAEVEPGQFIVAAGNACGMKGSVYYGYVIGTGRTLIGRAFIYSDMIQISTPVKPGDPGGPVVDSRGHIIGIVSRALLTTPRIGISLGGRAAASRASRKANESFQRGNRARQRTSSRTEVTNKKRVKAGSSGKPEKNSSEPSTDEKGEKKEESAKEKSQVDIIQELQSNAQSGSTNFALPINFVMNIVSKIKKHGRVERPLLGVSVMTVPMGLRREVHLTADGVIVSDVLRGSPADVAGVKVRDVITHFNSEAISEIHELRIKILNADVGKKADLTRTIRSTGRSSSPGPQPAPDDKDEKK
jgi:serine protease Do